MLTVAAPAAAGPWADLPQAVVRLRVDPSHRGASAVVAEAEASIMAEAAAGRVPAVSALMEAYASLVMRLHDGERRLQHARLKAAERLHEYGLRRQSTDMPAAISAWAVAAAYDPAGGAVDRLRSTIYPPAAPEDGATWQAPIDGAELVYLSPSTVRVGCADRDKRCRQNEVYFRWVKVSGLWVETTEVSNRRYRTCVEAGACSPPADASRFREPARSREPVVGVTWRQARDYAEWVGRRLPSEAEWERVARGSSTRSRYPWGTAHRPELAQVLGDTELVAKGPADVASFPPDDNGVFDLAGNVWEWCQDRYQPGLKDLPDDGSPVRLGLGRVVRGGSWRRTLDMARVSVRSWFDESYRADDVGLRCVASPGREIDDAEVVATAGRLFPARAQPGRELAGARLTPEDRRYLEQRSLTWLVLEKRVGEAVLQAEVMLRRDPRDETALELLDLVEAELSEEAQAGNLEAVEELHVSFSRALGVDPRLGARLEAANQRLLKSLRKCGERFSRDGDVARAKRCIEHGMRLAVNDPELQRALVSLEPSPGQVRQWRRDEREMAWVPSGSYQRGASEGDRQAAPDEFPVRSLSVDGFWMDRFEVTNADYRRCVDEGACTPPLRRAAFDDPAQAGHPVTWVSWLQARTYAEWAGKRLPTEVEWEWAARAGASTRYPWGDGWLARWANGVGSEGGDRFPNDAPVGSFPSNRWGLYDLIGNVAEYVQDVYQPSHDGAPSDGRAREQETGAIDERRRVIRGGSYLDPAVRLRVSNRGSRPSEEAFRAVGFRCVSP